MNYRITYMEIIGDLQPICYTICMKEEKIIIRSHLNVLIIEEILYFVMILFFIISIFIVHQLFYIIFFILIISIFIVQMIWILKIFSKHQIKLTPQEFTAYYFITKSTPKLNFIKSVYYPYTIHRSNSYKVLDTFTIKYDDIKEYGFIFDLKGYFKYAKKSDIGFINHQGKRFHINIEDYKKKDLIYFINVIYKKTNKYPSGCLKDVLENNNTYFSSKNK